MTMVLSIAVPFFAIIFLGMFTRAIGFLERTDARTLSKFAFYVAVPPMLFVNLADKDPALMLNWGFVWRFELVTLVVFLGGALLANRFCALGRRDVPVLLLEGPHGGARGGPEARHPREALAAQQRPRHIAAAPRWSRVAARPDAVAERAPRGPLGRARDARFGARDRRRAARRRALARTHLDEVSPLHCTIGGQHCTIGGLASLHP